MGQVWTLDDWNDIIQQVNDLAQNPPDGCDPLEPLEEVEAPHKWSADDIQQVQDKLKQVCHDNTFSDIPDLWKQDTIDEINDAIGQGWCECDCDDTQGPILWRTMPPQTGVGGVIFSFCPGVDGGDPCPGYTPRIKAFRNDLMPPGTRLSRPGIAGRFWRLAGIVTYWNGKIDAVMGPSGRIACDGTVEPQDDDILGIGVPTSRRWPTAGATTASSPTIPNRWKRSWSISCTSAAETGRVVQNPAAKTVHSPMSRSL